MADFIWQPSPELVERANVTRLSRALGAATTPSCTRSRSRSRTVSGRRVVDDLGLEFSRPWDAVVDDSRGPEWTTWFVGGRMNIARNCLHRWAAEQPDEEALVWLGEDGRRESLTCAEASRQVKQLAEALVELGVGEGDRVALYMPMCPRSRSPRTRARTSAPCRCRSSPASRRRRSRRASRTRRRRS